MDLYKHSDILTAIVLSSEDAIISKNLNGTITTWNPAAEKIFGFSESEALGKNISIIIPMELVDEEKDIISRIKRGERIEHFETVRRKRDGSKFVAAITVSPIKNSNGKIIGASKIARDITEQKSAEEQRAMLAAIVESSGDAIISKDLDGNIRSWNKGAQKIFGYTADEVVGKNISIIIPDSKAVEEAGILKNIRSGKRVAHVETLRQRKDGRMIDISLTVSSVKNKSGKIIGASKIARDISEKVELERQKKMFTERLQEINEFKDEFMTMASHELRTPLTVIHANLQVLEQKMQHNENLDFVNKALRQIDKLSNLILDLLDVSNIQAGNLQLDLSNFDLRLLLTEAVEAIQQTSQHHKIVLKTTDQPLPVKGDRHRLEHVMINILTNAIKYSPNAEKIIVDAIVKKNDILVSVKDLGIGIPKEDFRKIFTRYYRVRGLASTFSGSGIGLYISFEIIKRHGGRMWLKSKLEKGSTFYFSMPISPDLMVSG